MRRYTKEKLYSLIPSVYREQDKSGRYLEALIDIFAEQIGILEDDIDHLYDNWFIETCDEWIVPYIADLVGVKGLPAVSEDSVSQRALVANTIRYRNSKGNIAMLEQLAHDITGWRVKAVECFQLLNTTQNINYVRITKSLPDMRNMDALELLDGPFDSIPHNLDVKSINQNEGYYNIRNIGLFLWRLSPYPVIDAPAFNHHNGRFSFNRLGYDIKLYNNPETTTNYVTKPVVEEDVPAPIRRNALRNNLKAYYAEDGTKSIRLESDNSVISINDIVVADLSQWKHPRSHAKYILAIDPELGRILFAPGLEPNEVRVSYYYVFSSDIGGGFYTRQNLAGESGDSSQSSNTSYYSISKKKGRGKKHNAKQKRQPPVVDDTGTYYLSINDALIKWNSDGRPDAIFEIIDSEEYYEHLKLETERNLELRSMQNQNALIRGSIDIKGRAGTNIILDGLLFDKQKDQSTELININNGSLSSLKIRNCTLIPRRNTSIKLDGVKDGSNNDLIITLEQTICGKIDMVNSDARLQVKDSIVDRKSLEDHKISDLLDNALTCHGIVEIENSTIFGKVNASILQFANNSIFTDIVTVDRLQAGCIRYCNVPPGSQVPAIYQCLTADISNDKNPTPIFPSEAYGDPGYAQLDKDVSIEILGGGDNGSEMGVFNNLNQYQRLKILESSLTDTLPAGLDLGVFIVDSSTRSTIKVENVKQ
jgi:hypothetical protein